MGCLFGIIRNILAVIGLITVIIVIILAVAFWQLTKTPALEGEMTPIEFNDDEGTYADQFDASIDQLEDDLANAAVGETVTATLTAKQATAKILEEIDSADIPVEIEDVWVNFAVNDEGEEVVQLLGKVDVGFATLTAGVEMGMTVEDGEPKIEIGEVAVGGGFGIPQQAKDLIADAIPSEEALTDMIKDLPIDLLGNGINIQEDANGGTLTFTGKKTLE